MSFFLWIPFYCVRFSNIPQCGANNKKKRSNTVLFAIINSKIICHIACETAKADSPVRPNTDSAEVQEMITIKEIASKLGLSTTTVSNVIHGKTKEVSADTIERVQKFLEEVEYVPNINARNLAQGQSKIIGVVLKSLEFIQ